VTARDRGEERARGERGEERGRGLADECYAHRVELEHQPGEPDEER
jgi:hypothetical protein